VTGLSSREDPTKKAEFGAKFLDIERESSYPQGFEKNKIIASNVASGGT
jgi:hypothetical protein